MTKDILTTPIKALPWSILNKLTGILPVSFFFIGGPWISLRMEPKHSVRAFTSSSDHLSCTPALLFGGSNDSDKTRGDCWLSCWFPSQSSLTRNGVLFGSLWGVKFVGELLGRFSIVGSGVQTLACLWSSITFAHFACTWSVYFKTCFEPSK